MFISLVGLIGQALFTSNYLIGQASIICSSPIGQASITCISDWLDTVTWWFDFIYFLFLGCTQPKTENCETGAATQRQGGIVQVSNQSWRSSYRWINHYTWEYEPVGLSICRHEYPLVSQVSNLARPQDICNIYVTVCLCLEHLLSHMFKSCVEAYLINMHVWWRSKIENKLNTMNSKILFLFI